MIKENYMLRALELAALGKYTARPNPMVGCVIVKNNIIIGEGFHEYFGGPHAEIQALKQAGNNSHGADCYVTLEPCNHHGKTPPCTEALIQAGIKQVIIATEDPNPIVKGKGIANLKEHHIEVITGVLAQESQQLNRAYFFRMRQNLPWVIAKLAITLDSKIADFNNQSKWISNSESRHEVQHLRATADAIMIGSNTALHDNPELSVRIPDIINLNHFKHPKKIIIDSKGKILHNYKLFSSHGESITYTARLNASHSYQKPAPYKDKHLDSRWILQDLANQQLNTIFIEGGGQLIGALLEQDLIHEIILFQCGLILGPHAKNAFCLDKSFLLHDTPRWKLLESRILGQDIMTRWIKS